MGRCVALIKRQPLRATPRVKKERLSPTVMIGLRSQGIADAGFQ